MKKFKVTLSYSGSITIDVDAENEKLAISKAEEMADNMDAKEFVEKLQPQLDYHDAEEIKN